MHVYMTRKITKLITEHIDYISFVAGFGQPNLFSFGACILAYDTCGWAYPCLHLQALKAHQAIQAQDHTKHKARH